MSNVNRLILAAVLVAGLATPVAAHVPERCADQFQELFEAALNYRLSVADINPETLDHLPPDLIGERFVAFFGSSTAYVSATQRLVKCIGITR